MNNPEITIPDNTQECSFEIEIIPDMSNYATKDELSAVGEQIPDISNLATKTEVSAVEAEIPDISGLATKTEVSAVQAQIPTVPTNISTFNNDANYVTNTVLQQNLVLSNALTTGNVSDNQTVYSDILSRLYTTFDKTKFSITGQLIVTDDGIASGFASGNNLLFTINKITSSVKGSCRIKLPTTSGNYSILRLNAGVSVFYYLLSISSAYALDVYAYDGTTVGTTSINVASYAGQWIDINYEVSNNLRKIDVYTANGTLVGSNSSTVSLSWTGFNTATNPYIGSNSGLSGFYDGEIDLKYFNMIIDGVSAFSGNKTGSDSYTIGGNTVTIPYTLTKGGAKIVDSAYRTAVQAVCNTYGSALYYTIDTENKNFTLPMGDLYGMLQKNTNQIGDIETILQSING